MISSRTLAQTALKLTQKPDAEKHINAFLDYLKVNNLIGLLPQVIAHTKRLSAQNQSDETLHVYSKYALSSQDIKDIVSTTNATDAPVEQHLDETVMGGFSATYKGHIYDGSLQSQVTRFKTMLTR